MPDKKKTLEKADIGLLSKLEGKEKKRLKKVLQSAQPTEYFGQDLTKLSNLIDEMQKLDLIKSDEKLSKKMKGFEDTNLDIVASAAELRKDYETLYNQLRGIVYPKSKGDMK